MIRHANESDVERVVELAHASGLFDEAEAGTIRSLMRTYFQRARDEGHACLLDVDTATARGTHEQPIGVAYYQPVTATDRTWELLLIAVRRDEQGKGRGSGLLRAIEVELGERGQRLLLVQTSGVPDFQLTRSFYAKAGYSAEARVRDYYEDGDDMVLFSKKLTGVQS